VTISESDFLTLPAADPQSENPLAFTFEGTPDFRSVFVFYGHSIWNFVAPPGPDAIVLPEMPSDLKDLTPEAAPLESIEARIFDSSAIADYAAFLASDTPVPGSSQARTASPPVPAPGTTERFAFTMLLEEIVDPD